MSEAELCKTFSNNVVVFRLKTRRLDVTPHTHKAAFSLKTVFAGHERYQFEEREVGVTPGEVLMVPPDRTYGSSIRSSEVTDSFSIFLPFRWVQEHMDPEEVDTVCRLLDSGAASVSLPLAADVASSIRNLATTLDQSPGERLPAQEALSSLMNRAFNLVETTSELAGRIDAAHSATRLELLRRVSRVRDLLESRIQSGVSLTEIAREACLSEFHVLRVFKQAFGTTPAKYLERRRMERARHLLLSTEHPIAEIAAVCGYSNLSAFGRAFRRAWGVSATTLRDERGLLT